MDEEAQGKHKRQVALSAPKLPLWGSEIFRAVLIEGAVSINS